MWSGSGTVRCRENLRSPGIHRNKLKICIHLSVGKVSNESWTLDRLSSDAAFLPNAKLTATPSVRTRFAKAFLLFLNFSSSRLHIKVRKRYKFRSYNICYLLSDSKMVEVENLEKHWSIVFRTPGFIDRCEKACQNFPIQGHEPPLHGRVWHNGEKLW